MLSTTSSGNRPMNGPCDARAAVGFDGLRTLKREDEDGWPGLEGASGTHLFIVVVEASVGSDGVKRCLKARTAGGVTATHT